MLYKRGAFGLVIGLIVLVVLIIGAVFYFSGSKTGESSIPLPVSDTGETSVPPAIPESSTTSPTPSVSQTLEVKIKDSKFVPAEITVKVGDTITWINEDTAPHTATASDNTFDTDRLTKGESGSHTFTDADVGTHPYICSIHPSMKGTVIVTA
ncbi:MAG: cupredoxin family copper-binding protein [Nanoarchaeota archaeon]